MSPIKSSTLDKIVHNHQQTIFFLLNTPNRMDVELIEEVNSAMHEVCADILDYVWLDVLSTGGNALGGAYHLLNSALSRQEGGFLQLHLNCIPIIILLLGATPWDDVESGLEVMKKTNGFNIQLKSQLRWIMIPIHIFTNTFWTSRWMKMPLFMQMRQI